MKPYRLNDLFLSPRPGVVSAVLLSNQSAVWRAYRLIGAAVLTLSILACSKSMPPPSITTGANAIPVEVLQAIPAGLSNRIVATGTLGANSEVKLSFKTGGIIKRVLVETGEHVRAGQLLAELDRTEVAAGAAQMQLNLRKAERDYARAEGLFKQDVIAKAQLDDTRTALDVARAGSVAMNFNSDSGRITAIKDGVILRRFAEAGEVIAPGAPVLGLSQIDASGLPASSHGQILKVSLSDVDAVRIEINDVAQVTFDALPGVTLNAHVATLAGSANPGTGLFDIELALEGATGRLSSGMIGQAVIAPRASGRNTPNSGAQALLIPLISLVEANAEHGVIYVIDKDVARSRAVQLGEIRDDLVIVETGITPAEQIVVRGAAYLSDGAKVTIRPALAALSPQP
jgi:RND family efflux transporter MFP subunit